MKKIILAIILCVVLMFAAIVAFELYLDWLACILFFLALTTSVILEDGRQELKKNDANCHICTHCVPRVYQEKDGWEEMLDFCQKKHEFSPYILCEKYKKKDIID